MIEQRFNDYCNKYKVYEGEFNMGQFSCFVKIKRKEVYGAIYVFPEYLIFQHIYNEDGQLKTNEKIVDYSFLDKCKTLKWNKTKLLIYLDLQH
jgi:hypothetical protein